ncbi:MAG: RNA-protein complex protein Nop10 [Candidatus Micrarchaeia archaeon]
MKNKLLKCSNCGKYTLKHDCPVCCCQTKVAHPSRYSPQDKYAKYRRKQLV